MTHRLLLSIAGLLFSTVVLGGCGDPMSVLPAGLAIFSGNEQSGAAGQPLRQPLVVTVADGNGRGVEGAQVRWEVISGDGTIPFLTYTDATGRASATWTLGWVGRTQTARAGVAMLADSSPGSSTPVTFTATANGAATGLVLVGGSGQAAIIDDTLPVPLRVRATNETGGGVAGVPILWATAGGGDFTSNPTISDAQGEAVVTWVLGPVVGAQTASATVPGLSDSPVTFTATARPAANTLTWTVEQVPPGPYRRVWTSPTTDVFLVGGGGTIRHFNGSSWEQQNSGTTQGLYAIWGDSPSDLFAVGDSGTILHYDGSNWAPQASGNRFHLISVWGSSAADVFAGGYQVATSSGIWHFDGNNWTQQLNLYGPCLEAVWGSSSSDVFAVGSTVFHYNGTTWSGGPSACSQFSFYYGVWGNGPDDVYVVGEEYSCPSRDSCHYDGVIEHYDGASWSRQLTTRAEPYGVWTASGLDVVIVGASGLILHSDGTRWRQEVSGTTQSILAVSGSSARDVWAITAGGLVLHGTR